MVQFGKTLNEVVKSDWRCHAVAYMELKRELSESHAIDSNDYIADGSAVNAKCGTNGVNGCIDLATNRETNNNDDDAHSVHTESSYCISDTQKANFFRIYEDSIRRLTSFYGSRVQWANEERRSLEKAVRNHIAEERKCKADTTNASEGLKQFEEEKKGNLPASSLTSFLMHQINNFSRDLGLALEFLALNATAFSKIMKKFDKRTGSDLREAKLRELKAEHPYLYDGGELKKCKVLCVAWTKELQFLLQQDSKMVVGHLKEPMRSSSSNSDGRVNLSLRGSTVSKLAHATKRAIDSNDGGENPQESSEMITKDLVIQKKPIVRFEGVCNKPAPGSIRKTKESTILEKMINRVNEELCLQKAESPFFDNALESEQTPPPSFTNSEVELAEALGRGEFCKIYEVSQFNVRESCHICFLHRGFKDADPTMSPAHKVTNDKAVLHCKVPSTAVADNSDMFCSDCADEQVKAAAANKNQHPLAAATTQTKNGSSKPPETDTDSNQVFHPKSTFSFSYDANISDYEELESDHEDEHHDYGQNTTRGFMKDHCLRNGEARYAIKRIRSDITGQDQITDAAIDLAREAEFLASLKHPNIIRIRGTINMPGHPKYSIVLDRLYDTLEVQMKKWKVVKKRHQGKFKGLIGKNGMMLSKLWMDQLVASYDLARAMAYLHSHGILHRDIKPTNIGFDVRGDIKIFDFGLAKELKPCEQEGEDKYHTDGLAGTRRYMAPEVAQVMPYGLSADVYSFGILMWEMLSLRHAFENHTREKHYKNVIVEGNRPKTSKSWPFVIKNLLERCWHQIPLERPTFQSVCQLIKFSMPNDRDDVSGRSADLMLRSYRSNFGRDDNSSPVDSMKPELHGGYMNPMQSESPSNSLTLSIRVKSPHMNQRKLHDHTKAAPTMSHMNN